MPYQIVHDGVVREFEFYAPVGWTYWHERASIEDGRTGLPLIIAMHGGGQSPETLATNWPFPLLFNSNDNTNWEDRCFVLYPYGFSHFRGLDGEPERGWNSGFSGGYLTVQDDVGFIKAVVSAVEQTLQVELDAFGIDGPPIDAERRFLFGYSNGGAMAYRLANEQSNYWGALWVMAGAFGGRAYTDFTPTVTLPPQGESSVSLFAHHGEDDTVIPPGPGNDTSGLVTSESIRALYELVGLPTAPVDETERYATSVRHLAAAIQTYRLYNNCADVAYEKIVPDALGNGGAADVAGGMSSMKFTFRQDGDPPNPEVIVYRDPEMDHTNFVPSSDRYFNAAEVWDFFKTHPRVPL